MDPTGDQSRYRDDGIPNAGRLLDSVSVGPAKAPHDPNQTHSVVAGRLDSTAMRSDGVGGRPGTHGARSGGQERFFDDDETQRMDEDSELSDSEVTFKKNVSEIQRMQQENDSMREELIESLRSRRQIPTRYSDYDFDDATANPAYHTPVMSRKTSTILSRSLPTQQII